MPVSFHVAQMPPVVLVEETDSSAAALATVREPVWAAVMEPAPAEALAAVVRESSAQYSDARSAPIVLRGRYLAVCVHQTQDCR